MKKRQVLKYHRGNKKPLLEEQIITMAKLKMTKRQTKHNTES
jgi:hypothetical protein